jgi:hypothetical protein
MKRTSFFLPDDLRDRLAAESQRSGVPVAELVRRYLDAMTPPITIGFGGLRKYVDRQGSLKVLVLSAREGKLLVEPGGDFFNNVQIWVDANLVRFEDQPVVPQVAGESTEQSLRLNIKADEPK